MNKYKNLTFKSKVFTHNSIKPISIKRKIRIIWDIILIHIIFRTPSFQSLILIVLYWKLHFQEIQLLQSALNESYGNRMI